MLHNNRYTGPIRNVCNRVLYSSSRRIHDNMDKVSHIIKCLSIGKATLSIKKDHCLVYPDGL